MMAATLGGHEGAAPGGDAPARERPRTASLLVSVLVGALVPLAITVVWIPLRVRLPNTDLALVLAVAVAAVGVTRHRSAVVLAAVSGALWFEFFDTVPYERLAIARNPDIETTIILAVVSAIGGELVLRARRYRQASRDDEESLTNVRDAAQLVASGEELVRVIESVIGQLTQLFGLAGCTFEATAADPPMPRVRRDGLVSSDGVRPHLEDGGSQRTAELPVVVQGEELGYFVLAFGESGCPSPERLRVGVTLSDHVGAAFLAQAPPPPPEQPEPRLRVLTPGERSPAKPQADRPQETAGLPSHLRRMIS